MNKKTVVISIIGYLIISVSSYFFFNNVKTTSFLSPTPSYTAPKIENGVLVVDATMPRTEECPLNGKMLTTKHKELWEKRRPLGVMIENHKEARPQSGLSSADIIYEAVAEGGITRFLAIYYCEDAKYIGPVRSARMYFLSMLQEYGKNPLYAHVGGANTPGPANALGEIDDLNWSNYNDLNQFAVPFPYYWRDYDRLPDVATEHTMYSSTSKLWDYATKKRSLTNVDENSKSWDATFTKWKFKEDDTTKGTVAKITFDFWANLKSDFTVDWIYNKTSNAYKRNDGGVPHLDKNTGKQLESKTVVVLFVKESPANDGYEGGHLLYKTLGMGDALVFMDGKAIEATWSKKTDASRTILTDKNDKEISFNKGQIFFEILPIGNKVQY
jgi:hypothetical protein